jgi:hypothetical protein
MWLGWHPNAQHRSTEAASSLQPEHTGFQVSSRNKPAGPRLPVRPNPAFGTGAFGSPPGSSHMQRWDVTATEKADSDRYFENLDPQTQGDLLKTTWQFPS